MYKMFSSYLTIVPKEQMPIDMEKLNQAILGERGYYEMIVDDENKKSILRFNINAFRNNYYISDLVKMNLDYHAIEVGTVSIGSLTMESEFGERQDNEINGFDIVENRIPTNSNDLKVYDVILAGVYR